MNKVIYCIYVGICRFRVNLPFTMANNSIATAPPTSTSTNRPGRQAFLTWFDDVYLTLRHTATSKRSRFAESDNFSRPSDTNITPRRFGLPAHPFDHDSGKNIRIALTHDFTTSFQFTNDYPRSTRPPPSIRRITLLIVMIHLSVWPPPPTSSNEQLIHQDSDKNFPQFLLATPAHYANVRRTYLTGYLIVSSQIYWENQPPQMLKNQLFTVLQKDILVSV